MRTLTLYVLLRAVNIALVCSNGIAKVKNFSASWVYFGGIRGAERIVGAYIHGSHLMEVPSYLRTVASSKSKNTNGKLQTYGSLSKASLWTCNRSKVVARAVSIQIPFWTRWFLQHGFACYEKQLTNAWRRPHSSAYRPTKGLIGERRYTEQ